MFSRSFGVSTSSTAFGLQVVSSTQNPYYTIDARSGDGTWEGPTQPFAQVIDLDTPYPSREQTHYVLNESLRQLGVLAPDLHKDILANSHPRQFLKVREKELKLAEAAKHLSKTRKLPELSLSQLQSILSAARYLSAEPDYTVFEALQRARLFEKNGDLSRLDASELGLNAGTDPTSLPFYALIFSALAACDNDFNTLRALAEHDRPMTEWLQKWQHIHSFAERFREVGRALRKNPLGYWQNLGTKWSKEFVVQILKDYGDVVWKNFGDVHAIDKPRNEEHQLESLFGFLNMLSRGQEQNIQGYACYAFHQPSLQRKTRNLQLQLQSVITTEFATIATISLREGEASPQHALVVRVHHPENERKDQVFLIRLGESAQHFPVSALDRKLDLAHLPVYVKRRHEKAQTILRLAVQILNDVAHNPRFADSRGKLFSTSELAREFAKDPNKILFPSAALELKGFCATAHPDLTDATHPANGASFHHLFFVESGQAVALTVRDAQGSHPALVVWDSLKKTYVVLQPNRKPVTVTAKNLKNAEAFSKSAIEAALHFLKDFGFIERLPAAILNS